MANWMGGSCPAMANQVADGYILLSVGEPARLPADRPDGVPARAGEGAAHRARRGPAGGRRARPGGPQPQDRPDQLRAPGRHEPDRDPLTAAARDEPPPGTEPQREPDERPGRSLHAGRAAHEGLVPQAAQVRRVERLVREQHDTVRPVCRARAIFSTRPGGVEAVGADAGPDQLAVGLLLRVLELLLEEPVVGRVGHRAHGREHAALQPARPVLELVVDRQRLVRRHRRRDHDPGTLRAPRVGEPCRQHASARAGGSRPTPPGREPGPASRSPPPFRRRKPWSAARE